MFPWQQWADSVRIAIRLKQEQVLSWKQLSQKINETAGFLHKQEITAGSGIALCGKNSFELLLFYLAGLQLNMRVLGINPAFPQDKIRQICTESQISALLDFRQSHVPSVNFFAHKNISHQPYTLTLTSGSSGSPRAVVHNIAAHLANAAGVCELMHFTQHCSWLLSLPLYHVSGQGIVWRWLLTGAELHLPADDFYHSVTQSTHVSLVPTQLQRLLNYFSAERISRFHTSHILLGGTQIPTELTEKLTALGIQSYSGYGMTEMASTVFAKKSDGKQGVGQALSGREYRIENEEIWLRGAGLGLGYWRNGSVMPFVNAQGWYQTKDKGCWIDDELVVLGRLDNMFISGGENIQPEEIERVLNQKENVLQAFVVPVKDHEFGQRPAAFIEFSSQFSTALTDELAIWLSDKIERFKQPVAYYELNTKKFQQAGGIKISRALLKAELEQLS